MPCPPGHTIYHVMPYTMPCLARPYPIPCYARHMPCLPGPYHIPCHACQAIPCIVRPYSIQCHARQAIPFPMPCPPGHTIYHAIPARTYHIPCHASPGHNIYHFMPTRPYHIPYHAHQVMPYTMPCHGQWLFWSIMSLKQGCNGLVTRCTIACK